MDGFRSVLEMKQEGFTDSLLDWVESRLQGPSWVFHLSSWVILPYSKKQKSGGMARHDGRGMATLRNFRNKSDWMMEMRGRDGLKG